MLSKEKLAAMKYLKKEFDNLQHDPILSLGCTVGLEKNDIFHWKITLIGPVDTPYAGGLFILTADFPEKYPEQKPEVKFVNKIYHLNVSPRDGHICINILNSYKPRTPIVDIISGIFSLFYNQNPESPYDHGMADEYRNRKDEFDKKAKEWTLKYASMNQ